MKNERIINNGDGVSKEGRKNGMPRKSFRSSTSEVEVLLQVQGVYISG